MSNAVAPKTQAGRTWAPSGSPERPIFPRLHSLSRSSDGANTALCASLIQLATLLGRTCAGQGGMLIRTASTARTPSSLNTAEDHPARRRLQDACDDDIHFVANVAAPLLRHDHRAVVQITDPLA